MNSTISTFRKILMTSLVTVLALIAIGSIVRSTGSGMGCPDWPKCFGQYIPPTSVDQLPLDYKVKFAVKGRKVAEFSAFKTWVEYTNRLFGVWTGIITLILALYAFRFKTLNNKIFWNAQAALIMVIFNGWLGSKVVSSHLSPGIITLHMVLAIVLVFILLNLKDLTGSIPRLSGEIERFSKFKPAILLLLILIFIQVVLGTQVREQIDHITNTEPNLSRSNWLDRLDWVFYVHRSFTVIILLCCVYLAKSLRELFADDSYGSSKLISIVMVLFAEIGFGVALAYFSFPVFAQPIHLLLAIILLIHVYELYLYVGRKAPAGDIAL